MDEYMMGDYISHTGMKYTPYSFDSEWYYL